MEEIMTPQEKFIAETQRQIEDWQAQMAEYKKGLEAAEVGAKAAYEELAGQLEESISNAQTLVKQAKATNEKAWGDMGSATQKALDQLQEGWQKAISRYS
jgi:chromosome segregation ATPase